MKKQCSHFSVSKRAQKNPFFLNRTCVTLTARLFGSLHIFRTTRVILHQFLTRQRCNSLYSTRRSPFHEENAMFRQNLLRITFSNGLLGLKRTAVVRFPEIGCHEHGSRRHWLIYKTPRLYTSRWECPHRYELLTPPGFLSDVVSCAPLSLTDNAINVRKTAKLISRLYT